MGARRRKKYRLPVLSRLTVAWWSAALMAFAISGAVVYFAYDESGYGRVAMPIEGLEVMARPAIAPDAPNAPEAQQGLRLAAPNLRNPSDEVMIGAHQAQMNRETNDILIAPPLETTPDGTDFAADEIVITIAGQSTKQATPVTQASLPARAPAVKIPDPDPALLRKTPLGAAPKIADDGRRAVSVYAHPFDNPRGRPRIAIVLGGLGINTSLTERAIDELPAEISLAFAPYAKNLEFWTEKARRAGHEVLIELPMEGYGANQAALGPAALISSRTPEENLQRLEWLMARFGGYFAATNYMGGKFSADGEALAPVLAKLAEAGVGYIDDTGAARGAAHAGQAYLTTVNRMIPAAANDDERGAVRRELKALEIIARRDGSALGKSYAYGATIEEIAAWAETLEEKGFIAAPASSVLRTNSARR